MIYIDLHLSDLYWPALIKSVLIRIDRICIDQHWSDLYWPALIGSVLISIDRICIDQHWSDLYWPALIGSVLISIHRILIDQHWFDHLWCTHRWIKIYSIYHDSFKENYRSAWFYLNACWTDGSICMGKHWTLPRQCARRNVFLRSWPWPMTLIFKVDPHIIQADIWSKFGDYSINTSAVSVQKALCVGVLKETKKYRNKETQWNLKGHALHWPNS